MAPKKQKKHAFDIVSQTYATLRAILLTWLMKEFFVPIYCENQQNVVHFDIWKKSLLKKQTVEIFASYIYGR